jgi:hypothetical protein
MDTEAPWGRVAEDGSVYVRTSDGERLVGQWPGGDPEEAMALYTRRFDGLRVEVELLERRLAKGSLSPEQARTSIATARESIAGAQAVGDLDGLLSRLDALDPLLEQAREKRKAARAEQQDAARAAKTRIVEEAEAIAAGSDWRGGSDRLRVLLDEWKALPRLDKRADDELWHRFSTARSTHTRQRKHHFAELGEKRDSAKQAKVRLAAQAEALSSSTDWGATARAYRDLMSEWKAAGSAGPALVSFPRRPGRLLHRSRRGELQARRGVRRQRSREAGHPRGGGAVAAGDRPCGRTSGDPASGGPLGGGRQGAARRHGRA